MHQNPDIAAFLKGLGVAVVLTALFAVWIGVGVGGDTSVRYVSDLATLAAAAAATVLCARAGIQTQGRLRVFWWLMAAASGAWMMGELVWGLYDLVLRGEVPVPSWADAGYLSAIPLAAAALLSHPATHRTGTARARSALDALVIATALLFLSWTLMIDSIWRTADLTVLGDLVTLAYPLGDVVVVFLVVLVIRGMTSGERLDLWCLLAGLLAITLSDAVYSYLTEVKGYETGNLIDTGWFAGYLAIALGAFCFRPEVAAARAPESPQLTPVALVAPFLPILTALTVAAVQIELGERLDDVAWGSAFALVGLVLLRQALLVIDLMSAGGQRDGDVSRRLVAALGGAMRDEDPAQTSRPSQAQP
jgi:hypothetical protein